MREGLSGDRPADVALAQVLVRRGLLDEQLHLRRHTQRVVVGEVATCRGGGKLVSTGLRETCREIIIIINYSGFETVEELKELLTEKFNINPILKKQVFMEDSSGKTRHELLIRITKQHV